MNKQSPISQGVFRPPGKISATVNAITECQRGGAATHPVKLDPYRVIYFGSGSVFKGVPGDLDAILKGSANIWFTEERNLEVTVLIDAQVSHYFKRRTMFPTQEILEERLTGRLSSLSGWASTRRSGTSSNPGSPIS